MSAATVCRWFAACGNETTKGIEHVALGLVPCCDRCATLVGEEANLVPLPGAAPLATLVPAHVCPCGSDRATITDGGLVCASCGKAV